MSKFKLGLSVVFSLFIVIAVVIFAASKGTSSGTATTNLTMWGFISKTDFDSFVRSSTLGADKTINLTYVQKTQVNFQNDFINALANGAGPDIVMVSQDMLLQNQNKLFVIPYASYNQRTFKDTFIQEGENFLTSTGVVSVPFVVDPLVMYWNRDIFNSAGLAQPPKYWDELLTLPLKLTQTDKAGNITQSAVAFGEWNNVPNAKGILSQLLLSLGNPVVDITGPLPRSTLLDSSTNDAQSPAVASVNFYTQFANPGSQTYSWNRSMPNSLSYFLSGNLALYFGFASELPAIRAKNPNLNFDVTMVPTPRQASKKVVYARMYGLSVVKASQNISPAFTAISELVADDSMIALSTYTSLPPVKRSLLATMPTDPYQVVFYKSALLSAGWLDPDTSATNGIFQNLVESVTGGRAKTSEAVSTANDQLGNLLK